MVRHGDCPKKKSHYSPPIKWLFALYLLLVAHQGISSMPNIIERRLGITQKNLPWVLTPAHQGKLSGEEDDAIFCQASLRLMKLFFWEEKTNKHEKKKKNHDRAPMVKEKCKYQV